MGYLGMVGGTDPCAVQIESIRAARPTAFRGSEYGISHEEFPPVATQRWVPYRIDPVTLEIEWREDLITGAFSEGLNLVAVMDDSQMVWHEVPSGSPTTSRLRVITRSGITISVGGEDVVSTLISATVIRLDSSHVLRSYVDPTSGDSIVDVLSVGGGGVSVVASTTYGTGLPLTVSRDGGEAGTPTLFVSGAITPFHYDGSGTLYCFGSASGFAGFPRIHAIPFSIGGSIAAPGLSWRSRDAQNRNQAEPICKIGSNECLVSSGGSNWYGFYDDGSQMHYNGTPMQIIGPADQRGGGGDGETGFGDYLAADADGDAFADLVLQSGTSLSSTPLDIIVRCLAVTGQSIGGVGLPPTRHDVALGATSSHIGGGVYRLWAFRW